MCTSRVRSIDLNGELKHTLRCKSKKKLSEESDDVDIVLSTENDKEPSEDACSDITHERNPSRVSYSHISQAINVRNSMCLQS